MQSKKSIEQAVRTIRDPVPHALRILTDGRQLQVLLAMRVVRPRQRLLLVLLLVLARRNAPRPVYNRLDLRVGRGELHLDELAQDLQLAGSCGVNVRESLWAASARAHLEVPVLREDAAVDGEEGVDVLALGLVPEDAALASLEVLAHHAGDSARYLIGAARRGRVSVSVQRWEGRDGLCTSDYASGDGD